MKLTTQFIEICIFRANFMIPKFLVLFNFICIILLEHPHNCICRFTKYTITSLEKLHKPQLYVEPDLGIPLDLLDLSVYKYVCSLSNPTLYPMIKRVLVDIMFFTIAIFLSYTISSFTSPPKERTLHLDPEDEELLRDDDPITPIKKDGIKRKERPTDKGVSWLVKTQYISPFSMESAKQVPLDYDVLMFFVPCKIHHNLDSEIFLLYSLLLKSNCENPGVEMFWRTLIVGELWA